MVERDSQHYINSDEVNIPDNDQKEFTLIQVEDVDGEPSFECIDDIVSKDSQGNFKIQSLDDVEKTVLVREQGSLRNESKRTEVFPESIFNKMKESLSRPFFDRIETSENVENFTEEQENLIWSRRKEIKRHLFPNGEDSIKLDNKTCDALMYYFKMTNSNDRREYIQEEFVSSPLIKSDDDLDREISYWERLRTDVEEVGRGVEINPLLSGEKITRADENRQPNLEDKSFKPRTRNSFLIAGGLVATALGPLAIYQNLSNEYQNKMSEFQDYFISQSESREIVSDNFKVPEINLPTVSEEVKVPVDENIVIYEQEREEIQKELEKTKSQLDEVKGIQRNFKNKKKNLENKIAEESKLKGFPQSNFTIDIYDDDGKLLKDIKILYDPNANAHLNAEYNGNLMPVEDLLNIMGDMLNSSDYKNVEHICNQFQILNLSGIRVDNFTKKCYLGKK